MTQKLGSGEKVVLVHTPKRVYEVNSPFYYLSTQQGVRFTPTFTSNYWKASDDKMIFKWGVILFPFIGLGSVGMIIGGCFVDKNTDPDSGILGGGITLLVITIIIALIYWRCCYKPHV